MRLTLPVHADYPAGRSPADNALVVFDEAWVARSPQDWDAWLRAITSVDHMLAAAL